MQRVDITPVAGADIQVGLLLAVLEDVTNEWREELGDVSEEQIVYQPFPAGHSIGALILHIADTEAFWLYEVGAGKERPAEELKALLSEEIQQHQRQFLWPTPPRHPLSWYFAQQDAVRERTRQTALALNDPEHIGRRRDHEFTLRWLLNHVISHEAYHGGQAVLLSLMQNAGR
jgi:uncharacterized damage-inducible protein DinB